MIAALENIITERVNKGQFKDLFDFCKRVDLRVCNKRVIENLIAAGAFDILPGNRAQKTEDLHKIMDLAVDKKKAALTGQMGLFSIAISSTNSNELDEFIYQSLDDWPDKLKLEKEKEVMGLYVSAQPLDAYAKQIKWLQTLTFSQALTKQPTDIVVCCGSLKTSKVVVTKKGDKMAFLQLEDHKNKAEVVVFPKLYAKVAMWLTDYNVFVVSGNLDEGAKEQCKIKANEIVPLDLFFEHWSTIKSLRINVSDSIDINVLKSVKEKLIKGQTNFELFFKEHDKNLRLNTNFKILVDLTLLNILEENQLISKLTL